MFLGDELPAWLLLAFGAALAVGTTLALVRPRQSPEQDGEGDSDLVRPPMVRSVVMIGLGTVCAVWALISLLKAG